MRYLKNIMVRSSAVTLLVLLFTVLAPLSPRTVYAVNLDNLPDPTRPGGQGANPGKSTDTPLVLQSILHSGQRRSAVINGQVKTVGSWVNGSQIRDIRYDSVIIARNGKLHVLRLPGVSDIKKAVMAQ
jgi:hypothetical protein